MHPVARVVPAAIFVLAACSSVTTVDATAPAGTASAGTASANTAAVSAETAAPSAASTSTTVAPATPGPADAETEATAPAVAPEPPVAEPSRLVADPPPPFAASIDPFEGEALEMSTWAPTCPVHHDDLRLLTLHHWLPDGSTTTGELVVHADWAAEIVGVFSQLYAAQFPIEEMRITTPADVLAPPDDDNHTTAFVCRAVTGGTTYSQHAYGLAIDINPLWNPYLRGDVLIPPTAAPWLDRDDVRPGMIIEGDAVVAAFDAIGWGWGGRWTSLDDWQHFSANGR